MQPDPDPRDDGQLLAALHGGDLGALRELYDRHAPWLSVRLARRCNDPEVVADALQDTFTAVWKERRPVHGSGRGRRLDVGHRHPPSREPAAGRKDVVLLDPASPYAAGHATAPSVEEEVLLGVEYGDLGHALGRLSPEMRAVVQATVLDGLTTKETARLLHVPENTVKTRLHRAKAHLRDDLAGGRA